MMKKRLSSKMTWWLKRGNPLLGGGFIVFWFILVITKMPLDPTTLLAIAGGCIFMGAFLWVITVKFLLPIADEVWDDGDALIVRRGNQEARISLENITNISYWYLNGVPRVTLLLREPSLFGERIIYCSPLESLFPIFREPKSVQELIRRVDAARRR